MTECTFATTLEVPYAFVRHKFCAPDAPPGEAPAFATPDGSVVDRHYTQIGSVDSPERMAAPSDCASLADFRLRVALWRARLEEAARKTALPVPIGHIVPRPVPPQIVTPEELADSSTRRKLMRNFDPETSPLSTQNDVFFADLLQRGSEFDPEAAFPEKGLNEGDVLFKFHLGEGLPWSSRLVPQRPSASMFSRFAEFEAATMRWCEIAGSAEFVPPTANQVGEITDLKLEASAELAPPPPPIGRIIDPTPLNAKKPTRKLIRKSLRKLQAGYEKSIRSPKKLENRFMKGVMKPAHVKMTTYEIVEKMSAFGVPVTDVTQGLTKALRAERAVFDAGSMTDCQFTAKGKETEDEDKCLEVLETDVRKFIMMDWATLDFERALNMPTHSDKDKKVGVFISEAISLEDAIALSFFSPDDRSIAKFSVLVQYFLGITEMQDKILQLDMPALERFVELATFTGWQSFPIDVLPEEEISEACMADQDRETQIEGFATSFRQAQMLYSMYSVVITASEQFYSALSFVRGLLHRSFQKITEIVMNDTVFASILDGFHSINEFVHRFYFRLLRMGIILQYTKTIRMFAGHDLFAFIEKGINSTVDFIRTDAHSLWQLMIHSDTSMALQLQLIQASPSSVVAQISNANEDYSKFLQSVFSIFRTIEKSFDYRPFPFAQFQAYFNLLTADLDKEQNITFLYSLMRFCVQEETIYFPNRGEYKELINRFAAVNAVKLCQKSTVAKTRCLKILYKIRCLEPQSVAIVDIWSCVLSDMASRQDAMLIQQRQESWNVFRNAVLTQKKFVSFILSSPELTKKMEQAFSSLDNRVIMCMIQTLPFFAKPLTRTVGLDEVLKGNLTDLWTKLTDPSVLIAGKILSAFKTSRNQPELCRTHASLVEFLLSAWDSSQEFGSKSLLHAFMNADHIKSELSDVFREVAGMYNRINQ